jgi:hypothetical protein
MRALLVISFFLFVLSAQAATGMPKDTTRKEHYFSVGGGFIKTSLNFFKNYQEETYSNGYGLRALYQFSETFRLAACFSKVQSVNIVPTWVNVNNSFYDLDAHFLMRFMDRRSIGYFVIGLSAQHWYGYYTGLHDINSWKLNTAPNTNYEALYFGGKLGMGAEIRIAGPLSGYGEFLFRITRTDVGFGLSDVVYGLGLKVNVFNTWHDKTKRRRSLLRFTDKYHWF